jgi:hypothetical protein
MRCRGPGGQPPWHRQGRDHDLRRLRPATRSPLRADGGTLVVSRLVETQSHPARPAEDGQHHAVGGCVCGQREGAAFTEDCSTLTSLACTLQTARVLRSCSLASSRAQVGARMAATANYCPLAPRAAQLPARLARTVQMTGCTGACRPPRAPACSPPAQPAPGRPQHPPRQARRRGKAALAAAHLIHTPASPAPI